VPLCDPSRGRAAGWKMRAAKFISSAEPTAAERVGAGRDYFGLGVPLATPGDSMCPRFFGIFRLSYFVSIRYNPHRRWQTNQVEAKLALKAAFIES
jgi:hypothetical protein